MKIGIDARPLKKQRAGIGTYVYNIVKYLNGIDNDNEYYLFSNKEVVLDFELGNNWHIVVENFPVGTLWLSYRGGALIKHYGIDVFWGTQHVLPWGKNDNVRYVLTICDLAQFRIKNIGSRYNTIIQRFFVKGSCKKADRILAISEATKYDIIDIFGIESSRIACTYLAGTEKPEKADKTELEQVKNKFKINGKYFLYVSTIEPRKNVETIIAGFNSFMDDRKDRTQPYYMVLAGGLGWKYEGVLKQIENSSYKDNIIMTGFISQKEKQCLFEGALGFVYPSLYEGFGIPLLEAMNYGLPIITTNVSSLPEVGQDAVMYIKEPKDAKGLAALLTKCSKLSDEEKKVIADNDKKQRDKFSWEKCARETARYLTE